MGDVVRISPLLDIPGALREISGEIERGELEGEHLTLVFGDQVFHLGTINNRQAVEQAAYNLSIGMHKLMTWQVEGSAQ